MKNRALIPSVNDGETFTVGGYEFIKFPEVDGNIPAVMKDNAFCSYFGENNDFRYSTVLRRMQEEILPKIAAAVGAENLCTVKTDLTTLDGLKHYGEMESLISLPTIDFYRDHVSIFDKHNPNRWWWLATPESAKPHEKPLWVLCVAPSGRFNFGNCGNFNGVRPFLVFNSSIFESSHE